MAFSDLVPFARAFYVSALNMHLSTNKERESIQTSGGSATMEKNNSRDCGICGKNFSSSRAMGGHMRSHFAKLPIPPKPETENQALDHSAELTQCAIQSAPSLACHPQKKPTQDFQSPEGDILAFLAKSGLYPKNPTGKRSKCRRREAGPKQLCSITERLQAEQAARTIMMMSRDKWAESKEASKMEAEDSENGRDDSLIQTPEARFKCGRCGKIFRSHQALGGHRSNHKKNKNQSQRGRESQDDQSDDNGDVGNKLFECPSCFRLFKTAQALGKHKKVHFSNAMVADAHTGSTSNESGGMLEFNLDLNFPAQGEDAVASHNEFLGDQ